MKVLITTIFVLAFTQLAICQDHDIQGHRGCRGLMPENSIPGFLKAIDLGVTTVEMDVVVSADGKIIVSHDPYFSSKFCVNELGLPITKKEEKELNLYKLDYEDIKMFDCGINGNPDFPEQQKLSMFKPLLCDVLKQCEEHVKQTGRNPVQYNIELKSSSSGDNISHPGPELFTRLVYEGIKDLVPAERIIIQSFDPRIVQFWKMRYDDYPISFLMPSFKSPDKVIEQLGFKPDIYSPHFKSLTKSKVEEWHNESVKVIPWTVNKISDMQEVLSYGVDGLITDYPNRYFESIAAK
jgi:glycerophosphoryl diester phosphodiesterase